MFTNVIVYTRFPSNTISRIQNVIFDNIRNRQKQNLRSVQPSNCDVQRHFMYLTGKENNVKRNRYEKN
jgi:hypothetical protein